MAFQSYPELASAVEMFLLFLPLSSSSTLPQRPSTLLSALGF